MTEEGSSSRTKSRPNHCSILATIISRASMDLCAARSIIAHSIGDIRTHWDLGPQIPKSLLFEGKGPAVLPSRAPHYNSLMGGCSPRGIPSLSLRI